MNNFYDQLSSIINRFVHLSRHVLRRNLLNGKEQVSFVRTGFNVETIIDELGLSSGIIRELSVIMK